MVAEDLKKSIASALETLGYSSEHIHLEHPAELSHGDYATNAALVAAKEAGKDPRKLAAALAEKLGGAKPEAVERVEVAGPGFVNFFLSRRFFEESLAAILRERNRFGKNKTWDGKKVIIEYTDPNPFKEFHVGHLMSNSIGESISRIFEWSGGEVMRVNYQGDVGLHVAKAVWHMKRSGYGEALPAEFPDWGAYLGAAYRAGANAYEKSAQAKREIDAVNKAIYERSDEEINRYYDFGKRESLEYFETLYARLGTKFDNYFFESVAGPVGQDLVRSGRERGIFEVSDGAVVFRGEKYGLHTRVFINKEDLPTYEAKELGLAKLKHDAFPDARSFVVTGNEVADYFKVVIKAMELVFPDLALHTRHVPHGMLRLPSGKMSSRSGGAIAAGDLLDNAAEIISGKITNESLSAEERAEIADAVGTGAVKYSILRQAIGRDIVFDFDTSLSFEGNSGPYLAYTHARACSVLAKAQGEGVEGRAELPAPSGAEELPRLLYRFPEVVLRAKEEREPHHIATFLFEVAQAFNNFYAKERIVDAGESAPYRLALTEAVAAVLRNGLHLLGMQAPVKM